MSTNLAYSAPLRRPAREFAEDLVEDYDGDRHPRRVRIVTTRAQRRSRPKVVYGLVAISVIFGIFMAQLLLTIALSSGAYSITRLQNQQVEYGRVASSLGEKLDTVGSTQNLAANATALGMVPSSAQAFLRLSDGKVIGHSVAAQGKSGKAKSGADSSVPNSLLTGLPLVKDSTTGHGGSNTANSGSDDTESNTGSTISESSAGNSSSGSSSSGGSGSTGSAHSGDLPSPDTH